MAKIERTVTINAPVEKVFTYIADPMTLLEYLPSMMEVKDVTQTDEGVGSRIGGSTRWLGYVSRARAP